MTYDAGLARARYELDLTQFDAAIARAKQSYADLARAANAKPPPLPAVPTPQAGGASPQSGTRVQSFAAEQRGLAGLEAQQARFARSQGDGAKAADLEAAAQDRLRGALVRTDVATSESIAIQRQLITVEQQAAAAQAKAANAPKGLGSAGGLPILPRTVESFGTQAIDQFKSGLLGIVGPAALVTTGLALAKGAVDSFVEAFKFKAQLDQNTASITAQLIGVRESKQVFAEAAVFADKYKLTQEDTTTAIQASIPLLRQSTAPLTDVLTVLAKLQVLKPEQGIQGAAFALGELQGGQARSLETRFNIPIAKATEMKNEIQKGGDAVQILGKYLDGAGIGAEALTVRTKGAAGALNDAAIAAEQLKLAQAEFAAGPGTAILREQTTLTRGLARLFGGSGGIAEGIRIAVTNQAAGVAAQNAYNLALQGGATQAQASAASQEALNASLQQSAAATTPAAAAHEAYGHAMAAGATEAQARAAAEAVLHPPLVRSAGAYDAAAAAALYYADVTQHGAQLVAASAGAFDAYVAGANAAGIALQDAGNKLNFFAQAADIAAQKSVFDTAAKDAQQAITNKVAFETNAAADAFIKLNPNLDASQAFAAAAAAGLGPLVAGLVKLKFEANKARAALLGDKLDNQTARQLTGADSDEAGIRAGKRAGVVAGRAQGQAAAAAAAEAQRQYQESLGNVRPALGHAKAELAQLTVGSAAYFNKLKEIHDLEEKGKPKAPRGGVGGVGVSAFDKTNIKLAGDERAQLAAVNAELGKANLTALQRNQLEIQRADLVEKIATQEERARDAQLSAQLDTVKDAQARLKEAREAAGLEAQLRSGKFSAQQQETARLRLSEIGLEQEKRRRDIAKEVEQSGGAAVLTPTPAAAGAPTPQAAPGAAQAPVPVTITQQVPIPNVAGLAPSQPSPINLSLTIQIDSATGTASVVNVPPGITMGMIEILNKAAVRA